MTSSILASLGIFALAFIAKFLTGDWFHPAAVFCLLWSYSCGIAILVAPEDITSGSGPLWILLNAALVVTGGVAGSASACSSFSRRHSQGRAVIKVSRMLRDSKLRQITAVCSVLGIAYVILLLNSQGIRLTQVTTLEGLGQIASKITLQRYSGTAPNMGILVRVATSALYLAPLFGGTLFVYRQRRSDIALSLFTMLPSLLSFVAQSTRAAVLYGVTMWVAGYITGRISSGLRVQRIRVRSMFHKLGVGIIVFFALIALISSGQALRGELQTSSGDLRQSILSNLTKTYLGGHLGALSEWMDNTDLPEVQSSYGLYTFAGVYEMIVPGSRVIGIFNDYAMLPTGATNVYTYFRGLIEDATLPGSLLVTLVLGFLGGFTYRKVLEGKQTWRGILAGQYAWILFGITSLFNYNSTLLAIVAYAAWCFCTPFATERRHESIGNGRAAAASTMSN